METLGMAETVPVTVSLARPAYREILDGIVMCLVLERTLRQRGLIPRIFEAPTGPNFLRIHSLSMTLTNAGGDQWVIMLHARTVIENPRKIKGNIARVGWCQILNLPPIPRQRQDMIPDLVR